MDDGESNHRSTVNDVKPHRQASPRCDSRSFPLGISDLAETHASCVAGLTAGETSKKLIR